MLFVAILIQTMYGGLKYVLENIKVKNLVISKQKEENYKDIMKIALSKDVNIIIVKAGDRIMLDKTSYIDILYPKSKLSLSDINNNSIVAKLVYKDKKILFTGDIERQKEAEEDILSMYDKKELECDILKVAHHGSKGSTTDEFLNIVSPKIALIGVRRE